MNYFQTNMKSMGKNHTKHVKKLLSEANLPEERSCSISGNGVPYYRHLQDGRWRNLSSAYSPVDEARRQCDSLLPDNSVAVCFVMGEAGFYHVEEILNRVSPKTLVIFISKNPSFIKMIMETRDISQALADPRLILAVSPSEDHIKRIISDVISKHPRKVPTFSIFEHPVEAVIQKEFFHSMKECIAWMYRTLIVNFNTTAQYEGFWAENFMSNIPYFLGAKIAEDFTNSWTNKPVIIVGAGPSLQKNIHVLHEAKGKALIFCVDTAYRILQKHGVKPDLIITVDGTPANAKHLEGCEYEDVPLMADAYSHYEILRNHKNSKLFIDTIGFHAEWWKQIDQDDARGSLMSSGGSVATVAFNFARKIGANPVILTGVDLSYPNGKYYADGAVNSEKTIEDIKKTRQLIELKDIYGNQVYTTNDYYYYLNWLEKQTIQEDRLYINATEGGALKKGFVIQTLKDAVIEHCSDLADVDGWIRKMQSKPVSDEQKSRVLKNIKKSYLESKALVKYSSILIERLYKFISLLESGMYLDLPELTEFIQKGYEKTMELGFALSFINAYSLKVVWRDFLIENAIDHERTALSRKDIMLMSARRTIDLFSNFNRLAQESVQFHRNGLQFLEEVLDLKGEAPRESKSRVS